LTPSTHPSRLRFGAAGTPFGGEAGHLLNLERRIPMKIGRSAKTGRFTTVKKAAGNKSTHVVETIKPKR
jgi:hypothetical protein